MISDEFECITAMISQDAVEIKVTHIVNLYHIRISEISNRLKKGLVCKKLQKLIKPIIKHDVTKDNKPKVGDDVIVSTNFINNEKMDLPDWTCRGIIMDTTPTTTDIFFLDDGITINIPSESLIKYNQLSISMEPITSTIGIYNILPMDPGKFCIIKEWSKLVIDLVRDLIQVSSKIYFEMTAYDKKNNKKYGDLFFLLENKYVSLTKFLIHSHYAVFFNNDLLKTNGKVNTKALISYKSGDIQKEIIPFKNLTWYSVNNYLQEEKSIPLKKKQSKEKILIRTKFTCEPLEHIENARFTSKVHKSLKNHGLRTPKKIQSYMWPAIKQGLNVVTVSPKTSGKTIGYAVPILSSIAANEEIIIENQKSSNVIKPIALILCTSVNKCIDVTTKCNEILYYHKHIRTFAAYHGIDDKKIMTHICNRFHILISTIPFLLKLLEKYSNKLSLLDISYFVLDAADISLNQYLPELTTLIRKYRIFDKKNNNIQKGLTQIITVSETWTDKISSFVETFMQSPYICIGSFIEAAAFCRVQGRMLIRRSDKKKHEILCNLGDYTKVKTMVLCLENSEALDLNHFLTSHNVETLLAHEKLAITQIHDIKDEWSKYLSGMYPVVICTDQVLSELEISDIQFLIHYSITVTSRTQFNRRFSVLMDNWQSDLKFITCKVLIFFDETKENVHFKGVVNILKRLKVELPKDWDDIADGLEMENDKKKKNYPLCDFIKLFGRCEINSCPYRHRIIAEVDTPATNISVGDELKLLISFVHNASHFSARVLECIKRDKATGKKKIIEFAHDIIRLRIKMKQHYTDPKNRRMQKTLTVGTFCVLKNAENDFLRMQILNIVEKDVKTGKPSVAKLRCLDDGCIHERIYVHELLEISEEFLNYKISIIDIFLVGLLPSDGESKWTDSANQKSHNWVKQYRTDTSFAYTKVLIHIGHSIWTDSLVFESKVIGFPNLISKSINNILISYDYAVENKTHLTKLLNLCNSAG